VIVELPVDDPDWDSLFEEAVDIDTGKVYRII
jgi:hypothetical protein